MSLFSALLNQSYDPLQLLMPQMPAAPFQKPPPISAGLGLLGQLPASAADAAGPISADAAQSAPQASLPLMSSPSIPALASPLTLSPPVDNSPSLLNTVRQNIAAAFPNNPTMQQVALSQAMLESGFNPTKDSASELATKGYNLFGIKGHGTAGSASMPTTEFQGNVANNQDANFAMNQSLADSVNQYKNLLSNPRYKAVMASDTPENAFKALQASGYATDPNYASKLSKIHQLYVAPLYPT